nr:hypothetical protein [Tanacetum cinerariifolium]
MGCKNHPEAKIITMCVTMCVKWKIRDDELSTRLAPVIQGVVEFEETMTNTCSVYGSSSGPIIRLNDVKDLHEVLPISKSELSESVSVLYKKLEERDVEVVPPEPSNLDSNSPDPVYSDNVSYFSVSGQGKEFTAKEDVQPEQDIMAKEEEFSLKGLDGSEKPVDERGLQLEPLLVKQSKSQQEECVVTESNTKDEDFDDKELLLQELELALNNVVDFEKDEFDSQEDSENVVYSKESGFGYEEKTVADDFLNMLGIEHSPFGLSFESESNSPRERLLRQFEKDSLANGSLFNFNIDDDDEIGFNSNVPSTLMWDSIPEERSPSGISCGSGGLVEFSPEEPLELPPLGEGLGPFVQTSNGGFLRSMNPEIFKNAKSGGNLIMQVSSPVVVPTEMGSGIMDVLQGLASVGIEKLSMQANKLMPLEDISGKTIQQIAWASTPSFEAPDRYAFAICLHYFQCYYGVVLGWLKWVISGRRFGLGWLHGGTINGRRFGLAEVGRW